MVSIFSKKNFSEMFDLPDGSAERARNKSVTQDSMNTVLSFAKAAAMAQLQAAEIEKSRSKGQKFYAVTDPRHPDYIDAPEDNNEEYPGELFPNWRFD